MAELQCYLCFVIKHITTNSYGEVRYNSTRLKLWNGLRYVPMFEFRPVYALANTTSYKFYRRIGETVAALTWH